MKNRLNKVFKIMSMKQFWVDKEKLSSIRAGVSVILAIASFVLMFADIFSGAYFIALTSLILSVGFTTSAIAAGIFRKPFAASLIIAILVGVVLSYYAVSGGNEGFAVIWVLIVPMFAIGVIGMGAGLIISTYFLFFLPVLFHSPLNYLVKGKYSDSFNFRFPILYFIVYLMSVFLAFEKEYYTRKANIFLYLDELTGVFTRRYFFEKAEETLRNNPDEKFDVQISDIVDFKKINEVYGVNEADKILIWLADYIQNRMGDSFIIGRYGADQFIVMGPHSDMQEIIAPKPFNEFLRDMNEADMPNAVIKFGLYEDIPHDKPVVSSCDKAHVALNSIKKQYGKQRAFFNERLEEKLEIQRKIESSMHEALEQNQFQVYYQPKHDAKTGELVGAEALVRWIHPEFGFMSPGDFIPLFEQNGFIVETDFFVWDRSCQNMKRWQEMGFKAIPVSVNSSKLVFEKPDLLAKTQKVVDQYGISPKLLHLEVTETMMSDDIDDLVRKLDELRAKGFIIELDDFGSGYTSMNILSTLPIDIVKLDMSFMRQFGDPKRKKVLIACIKLAKDLGYKTVSEGVETKEQAEMLSEQGVDSIQGYYYSKPLPEKDFEEYMRKYM